MRCHVCNAEVGDNQRFCHECGESLAGVTDPTAAVDMDEVLRAAADQSDDLDDDANGLAAVDDVDDAAVAGAAAPTGLEPPPTRAVELGTDAGLPDPWSVPTGDQAALDAVAAAPPEAAGAAATTGEVPWTSPTDETVVAPAGDATTTLGELAGPTTAAAVTDQYTAPYGAGGDAGLPVTGEYPDVYDGGPEVAAYPAEAEPVRFRLTLVLGVLAVLTAALAAIADVTDVRTDRVVPGIENRLRTLDDIGSNLALAVFIGAGLMLVGGVLHCFNQRWGAGLAGGAGLAVGGWASVTIGLAEVPIGVAERITRDPSTPGPFVLTVTRDIGYWLIIALGVLGGLAFLLSLVSAGAGRRRGLDPWTAAVGALGGVVAAAGPLVPVGNATFSSNFGVNELPMAFFAGRLVQVAVLGLTAMIGFLLVRRWGLGLVAGGLSIPTFMWLTSLLQVGDSPIGIAVGNLGTSDTTPHAVTTVGMVVALAMLLVASVLAVAQRNR